MLQACKQSKAKARKETEPEMYICLEIFRAGAAVAYVKSVTCLCLALFSLRLLPRFAYTLVSDISGIR